MHFLASRAEARLNWLSRLRSAKGFDPEPPGLGIDDFLHSGASSPENRSGSPALAEKFPPESVKAEIHDGGEYLQSLTGYFSNGCGSCGMRSRGKKKKKKKKTASSAVKAETAEWLDVTSNALAELFCMREEDDELTKKRKKWRRKQAKPRICASSSSNANLTPSSSADGDNSVQNTVKPSPSALQFMDDTILTSLPLSAVNSVVAERKSDYKPGKSSPVNKRKGFGKINGTPDEGDANSSCYSTEVTLIDTSVEMVKFRKVFYRKGDAWKVREQKETESISDKCTTVGSVDEGGLHVERPKRKGAKSRSATTPSPISRTVDHDNTAECSSVKIQTGRLHSHNSSSSKDTDGHDDVRTEVEEHKDNIPNSRNSRKRLLYSGSMDRSKDGIREVRRETTEENLDAAPQSNLSPDHPVNQPMETLVFSLYQVFVQAGKSGLSAREAVSRILERGLPGLHEGGVVPRIEVAKTLRTSPYFMQLEESKFVLCSAVIGNEGQQLPPPINLEESKEQVIADKIHEKGEVEKEDHSESLQDWAALAAIRKIRTKRRSLTLGQSKDKPCLSKESAGIESELI